MQDAVYFFTHLYAWNGSALAEWILINILFTNSGQENREYDRGDLLRWPHNTLYPQKLALLRQEAAVARSA
jgi:hypothetical protein